MTLCVLILYKNSGVIWIGIIKEGKKTNSGKGKRKPEVNVTRCNRLVIQYKKKGA